MASHARKSLYNLNQYSYCNLARKEDDNQYLDLTLIAKSSAAAPLTIHTEQIFFGRFSDEAAKQGVKVYVDHAGLIYLPAFGYLKTAKSEQYLAVALDRANNQLTLWDAKGEEVAFEFVPLYTIPNTSIEIVRFSNPLLDEIFERNGSNTSVREDIFLTYHELISKAYYLLIEAYPWYAQQINTAIKRIVLFTHDKLLSFASIQHIGTNFFSIKENYDEIFFLEDLIHQSAHNILYYVASGGQDYFAIDAVNTKLANYTQNQADTRTVFSAFHGIFSLINITSCFSVFIKQRRFSQRQQHELEGRMCDNMRRLQNNIDCFNHAGIFTPLGQWLYKQIVESFANLLQQHEKLVNKYDLSNQDYLFSYRRFAELNPIELLTY